MKKFITFVEAQKLISDILLTPGNFSCIEYGQAYTMADKFYVMENKSSDKNFVWKKAKSFLEKLLVNEEKNAEKMAVEIARTVLERGCGISEMENFVRLMYLSYAYLDICYTNEGAVECFWLNIYNATAAVLGIDKYVPKKNFLCTREEVEEHKRYIQKLLSDAQNEDEVNVLLDSMMELDKTLKSFPQ